MVMSDLLMGRAHLRDNNWELIGNGGAVSQASIQWRTIYGSVNREGPRLNVAAEDSGREESWYNHFNFIC